MFPLIYYPNLMLKCGFTSRNIPSPDVFRGVVERRLEAKKNGDKKTANCLKLVVNTTYGAMLDKFNNLYDPLMGRSVCITGQLFLCELAGHLTQDIPTLKLLALNTDGIMVSFDDAYYPQVLEIVNEWQDRTGFELEEDKIKALYQKDVNNYIIIFEDGHIKCKGGYLVRGIAPAGAFNINNNFPIVSQAVIDYFTKGIYPEETVTKCNDIFKFQIIAKASGKYSKVIHIVDGDEVQVQKCNRVYATDNLKYGRLYKYHKVKQTPSVIANLPEHCIIDNANQLTINDISKRWYITLAYKYINDF